MPRALPDWGGGSNDCHYREETGFFALCPNINAPNAAKWGSPQFLGLGFLSFVTILITEIFGSPFMRNASIVRPRFLPASVRGSR